MPRTTALLVQQESANHVTLFLLTPSPELLILQLRTTKRLMITTWAQDTVKSSGREVFTVVVVVIAILVVVVVIVVEVVLR